MQDLGFIGLGNIGRPMASRLLAAGFRVLVFDTRSEVLTSLVSEGATLAASPREIARQCDIVCIAVVDDQQVEAVILGEDGVLSTSNPPRLLLIHSTVSPAVCRRVATKAAALGVGVVDAPVSGAASGAEQGTLTLLVGGSPEHVAIAEPVFNATSKHVFHVGPVGMGQVTKLCNNVMFTVNLRATLEAMELAEAAGVQREQMQEIAMLSTGQSWPLAHLREMEDLMVNQRQSVTAQQLGNKDLALALELAGEAGLEMPITKSVARL